MNPAGSHVLRNDDGVFRKRPENKIKSACSEWLRVSEILQDHRQVKRAKYSLEYYNADAEDKLKMIDDFKKTVKNRGQKI